MLAYLLALGTEKNIFCRRGGGELLEDVQIYDLQEKRDDINKWLNLPYSIAELEYELKTFSQSYYQEHSFYSHTIYDEIHGVITEAPRVEDVAINLADSSLVLESHIKRNKAEYKLFEQYVSRLPVFEVDSLNDKEVTELCSVIQEIKKISRTNNIDLKIKLEKEFKNRMEKLI